MIKLSTKILTLLFFSCGSIFSTLPSLDIERIKQKETEFIKKHRNLKYTKTGLGAAAAISVIGVVAKVIYDGKVAPNEAQPDVSVLVSNNIPLVDFRSPQEKYRGMELVKYIFQQSVSWGFALGLAGLVLKWGSEGYDAIKDRSYSYFLSKTDHIKFNAKQVFANGTNLDLFVQDYVEPDSTTADQKHHKNQIIGCYGLLIEALENYIAALAAKTHCEGNLAQEKWLLTDGNKMFVTSKRVETAINDKLEQAVDSPNFLETNTVREALKKLFDSVVRVSSNCKAQLK